MKTLGATLSSSKRMPIMTGKAEGLGNIRISALDGWRGIAILFVIIDHAQLSFTHRYFRSWMQLGQHGVTIFFVLSGFLITSRLLQEEKISLASFYRRRVRRLMPAAIVYLIVVLLIGWAGGRNLIGLRELASCIFSFRNYVDGPGNASLTIHFWSLSIEEQFYLIWPCILIFAGARKSLWIAIGVAVGCAWLRYVHWSQYDNMYAGYHLEARVDALLAGCSVALLLRQDRIRRRAASIPPAVYLLSAAALPYFFWRFHTLIPLRESVLFAILIGASSLFPNALACRGLSLGFLTFTGRISYSLYMWQIFFFVMASPWVALIQIPIVSVLSYYYLENGGRVRTERIPAATTSG